MSSLAPVDSNGGAGGPVPQRQRRLDLKLVALLLLIIPATVIVYVAWRLVKRVHHKRLAQRVTLGGTRKPGEVDDVELGQALRGGDWLNLHGSSGAPTGAVAAAAAGDRTTGGGAVLPDDFDPIATQAATQREKRARRRQYLDATVTGASGGGGGGGVGEGEEDDEDDDDNDFSLSGSRAIYAATMALGSPLFPPNDPIGAAGLISTTSQFGLPPVLSPAQDGKASAAGGAAAGGGGGAGASNMGPQRHYNPAEYSAANQVLFEQYAHGESADHDDDEEEEEEEEAEVVMGPRGFAGSKSPAQSPAKRPPAAAASRHADPMYSPAEGAGSDPDDDNENDELAFNIRVRHDHDGGEDEEEGEYEYEEVEEDDEEYSDGDLR